MSHRSPPRRAPDSPQQGDSSPIEKYEQMNQELLERLQQSRQECAESRRREQRNRDALDRVMAQVRGTGVEISNVNLEGYEEEERQANTQDPDASRVSSEGEALIAESDFDAPTNSKIEEMFHMLARMTRKVKKMNDKVAQLEKEKEDQEVEIAQLQKDRLTLRSELRSRDDEAQKQGAVPDISTLVGRTRTLCDLLFGSSSSENKNDEAPLPHGEDGVLEMEQRLIDAHEHCDTIRRVLDLHINRSSNKELGTGQQQLNNDSILTKVQALRKNSELLANRAASNSNRTRALESEATSEAQTQAMVRLLDLLSGEQEQDGEAANGNFDELSDSVCDKALKLRGELERLRRNVNVHSMALVEFERASLEVASRVGVPPKDFPNANDILNRLARAALGEPVLPPTRHFSDKTPIRGSDEAQPDDSCWIMLMWERIQHLRRAISGGNEPSPKLAQYQVPTNKLQQRYQSLVTHSSSSVGSSKAPHHQLLQESADSVRNALWSAMSQLESTIAELVKGRADLQQQREREEMDAQKRSRNQGGPHPFTRLLPLLPTSCKPRDDLDEKECFESVRFALSMHNAMASAALLNPATISKCIKVLDATCCGNHPGLDEGEIGDFAMADWAVLLRGVGVEGSGLNTGIFEFQDSKSIPEAVDAVSARLSHFSDKFFMKLQSSTVELQEARMELHHCYAQLTKYLLPQEYANAQLSSERPNVTMAELLVKLDDRVRTYESLSHKQQRSNDIAKGERSRLEQLLQTHLKSLGRSVGSIKVPAAEVNQSEEGLDDESDSASLPSAIGADEEVRTGKRSSRTQPQEHYNAAEYEELFVDIEKKIEHLKFEHTKLKNLKEDTKVRIDNYEQSHNAMLKRLAKTEAAARALAADLEVSLHKDLQPASSTTNSAHPIPQPNVSETCRITLEIIKQCQSSVNLTKQADKQALVNAVDNLKDDLTKEEEARKDTDAALDVVGGAMESHIKVLAQALATLTAATPELKSIRQPREDDRQPAEEEDDDDRISVLLTDMNTLATALRNTGTSMDTELKRSTKFLQSFYEASFGERPEIFDGNLEDMVNSLVFLSDSLLGAYRKEGVAKQVQRIFRDNGTAPVLSPESPYRPRNSAGFSSPDQSGAAEESASSRKEEQTFIVDTRLLKMHEAASRLATKIKSLFEVPYFAVRELAEDPKDSHTSSSATTTGPSSDQMYVIEDVPPLQSPYSEDTLIHTLECNLLYVERQLHRFGSGYKHAAVLVERDVNRGNKPLAQMLESLQETTVEELGLKVEDVQSLHHDISKAQNPCYFQRPVDPEREGLWVQASGLLGYVFPSIVEALLQWSKKGNEMKDQLDQIIEIVRRADAASNSDNFSGDDAEVEDDDAEERDPNAATTKPRVGYTNVVERLDLFVRNVKSEDHVRDLEAEVEKTLEENQLMKETTALEDQKFAKREAELLAQIEELTLQRDTSNSAAAVARSLLRRQEELEASRQNSSSVGMPPRGSQERNTSRSRDNSPVGHSKRAPAYETPTFTAEEKYVYAWKKSPPRNRRGESQTSFSRQTSLNSTGTNGTSLTHRQESEGPSLHNHYQPKSTARSKMNSTTGSKKKVVNTKDPELNEFAEQLRSELREREISPRRPRPASIRQASPSSVSSRSSRPSGAMPPTRALMEKHTRGGAAESTTTARSSATESSRNHWVAVSPTKSMNNERKDRRIVAETSPAMNETKASSRPVASSRSATGSSTSRRLTGSQGVDDATAELIDSMRGGPRHTSGSARSRSTTGRSESATRRPGWK